MPDNKTNSYFVVAAIVAAELHKAMLVARTISLTASNARAFALRAGHGAAGFKALTNFIDELAIKTVNASRNINSKAATMSRIASETARLQDGIARFEKAWEKSADAHYQSSISQPIQRTQAVYADLQLQFRKQVGQLVNELDELARELRAATVLATMSRVEASASGKEFESSLDVIATNVAEAAEKIQHHVKKSQRLFSNIDGTNIR